MTAKKGGVSRQFSQIRLDADPVSTRTMTTVVTMTEVEGAWYTHSRLAIYHESHVDVNCFSVYLVTASMHFHLIPVVQYMIAAEEVNVSSMAHVRATSILRRNTSGPALECNEPLSTDAMRWD